MIDFKITENGDIDIAKAYQYPYFIIDFYISARDERNINDTTKAPRRYPALRIDFDTDIKQYDSFEEGLLINFMTEKKVVPYNPISITSVYDKTELAQEVTIRLKTEIGEFQFLKDFGSELSLIRHSDIKSDITAEKAKQYAEEAISDVEFDNEYEVTTAWEEDISRYRNERLKIKIDTDKNTAYEATI